jgi:membrane-associated phospholipid phosphatase
MGRRRTALFCLSAPCLSLLVTEWLGKPFFHRTLGSALAYPSGHTTAAVSAGTLLVLLGWRTGGIRRAALVAALWAVPAASVVLYLLIHRSHYASDIVGGIGVGMGIPCLLAALLFGRRRAYSPAARESRPHQGQSPERARVFGHPSEHRPGASRQTTPAAH